MSRTAAEMAADRELPGIFALRFRNNAPWVAEITVAGLAIVLVLSGSLVFAIGISSFSVLSYYAIANYAAFKQPGSETQRLKLFTILGLLLYLAIGLAGSLLETRMYYPGLQPPKFLQSLSLS
jgi:APA family basic amino acid/polyamine antiporter